MGFDVAPSSDTFLFSFDLPHAAISREELLCLAHSGAGETRHLELLAAGEAPPEVRGPFQSAADWCSFSH
jgi:hypothetical protein